MYQERDEKQRREFLENLARIAHQPIVYIDESGLDERLKSEWARAPRGEKIHDDIPGKKSKRINVVAGLLNNKIIAPLMYEFNTNSEFFNTWIEQCLLPELPQNSVLVMDNAQFHKSEKTREIIEKNGHQLLFLPAYSPDFNPIEKYWAIIKSRVKKSMTSDLTLFSCLESVLKYI